VKSEEKMVTRSDLELGLILFSIFFFFFVIYIKIIIIIYNYKKPVTGYPVINRF